MFQDKNGIYNPDQIAAITANKDGNAVIHLNGGEVTTATKFDDVARAIGAKPFAPPAAAEPAK